jgi:hypothetical protein
MDEFFEVITGVQLGQHKKPIVLINLAGFFDPLDALMQHIIANGFAQESARGLYQMVGTVDEAMDVLEEALR